MLQITCCYIRSISALFSARPCTKSGCPEAEERPQEEPKRCHLHTKPNRWCKACRRPTDFNFCSRRASFRGVYCRWDARIWGSKSASSGYGQRSRIPCMVYGRHRPGVSSSPLCELLILTSVLGLVSEIGKICLPSFGRSRNRLFWVHALLSCLQELGAAQFGVVGSQTVLSEPFTRLSGPKEGMYAYAHIIQT